MKNFYAQVTEKVSSLNQNNCRTSWRSRSSSLLMAALMMAGIGTATAQVSIGEGTTTTPNVPINANYGYNYSQQIYTQAEISALGEITSVSFKLSTKNHKVATTYGVIGAELAKNNIENQKKITLQNLKVDFEEDFEDFELFWFSKPVQTLRENAIILVL